MTDNPRLVTAAELDDFPHDGMRYEVIDGELFMAAAPLRIHQEFSPWVYRLLYASPEATGWGKVYYAPVDVRFSDTSQVQPDLIVIRADRLNIYKGPYRLWPTRLRRRNPLALESAIRRDQKGPPLR